MTPNHLEDAVFKGNKRRIHAGLISSVMLNHFGFVGVWVWVSSLDDFSSKSLEDGMLSNDKCPFLSAQPTS